jgi:hypothetical protein
MSSILAGLPAEGAEERGGGTTVDAFERAAEMELVGETEQFGDLDDF